MASARSICQADPLAGCKAAPLFHQLSPSFLLPLHFSDVSCLRPLASSTSPPILPCRPTAPQKDTTRPVRKNASTRLLAVIRSRSRQHFLVNCLTVGLPSVMMKD